MFKKILSAFICFTLIISLPFPSHSLEISASSAVLMICGSREIIYEKNSHDRRSMASTTKIMTSVLALESGKINQEIIATDDMVRVEGTSIGLLPGDTISLEELVAGMLLQSGNDAANAVAITLGGTKEAFVGMMNNKAKQIGMSDTHFVTPSGLDADEHYSTAYDMALLADYALKNDDFVSICSQKQMTVSYGNPPYNRKLTNHNKLLMQYEGTFGVKTGFTKKSGRCLVSAARRGGVSLICVTLNSPNDWDDHKKLLDYGFDKVKKTELKDGESYKVPLISGIIKSVKAECKTSGYAYSLQENADVYKKTELPLFVYAPIEKGDVIGYCCFYYKNGSLAARLPITAAENAEEFCPESSEKLSLIQRITKFFKGEKNV